MARWQTCLERWTGAGLIEDSTAERIRACEAEQGSAGRLRRPIVLSIGLGAPLPGAGARLFVAPRRDSIPSAGRFGLVLGLVAPSHVAAAPAGGRMKTVAHVREAQ